MDNTYFAAKSSEETATIVLGKAESWFNHLYRNGYLNKIKDMWMAYHGAYHTTVSGAHHITFDGEQGELVQIAVNHLRSIAQNILTMVTSNRPSLRSRATNTDYKSLVQSRFANDLLDYYLREKRLEKYLKTAVEHAIVMASGYIKMDWNATSGEKYDYNPDTDTYAYEGDVEFTNLSPFDVVFDTTKESQNHDWVLCRTFKNRYDLAAKYPELADRITRLPTKSDASLYRFDFLSSDETDDIPVYEFYHQRTESMPDGRYLLFLSDDIVLMDAPMPYRTLPIYRISPSDILGTPYGYTPMFDLLPLQDAINSLYSTVLTNQNAFGVQNVLNPRGSDINVNSLSGGLNLIDYNPQAGKPEALNLTQTPPEIFGFIKTLETQMEIISGINSVARGNPEASLKSGTALAMVQSMAIQFISGLQQSYVQLMEDTGTGLINMLKDFASVPRIAIIAGKSQRSAVEKMFTGDDLSQINRVIVDVGNAMSTTTAGKMQMAESLIQYGIVKSPEQFFTVLNTGNINTLNEYQQNELLLIRAENENLAEGRSVRALAVDQHALHIKEHKGVLADPDLRKDEALTQIVLDHIQEHINLARTTDPGLLAIIGEQPLGPIQGTPPAQSQPGSELNQSAPPGAPPEGQELMSPPTGAQMPSLPTPPPPFEGNPVLAKDMIPS